MIWLELKAKVYKSIGLAISVQKCQSTSHNRTMDAIGRWMWPDVLVTTPDSWPNLLLSSQTRRSHLSYFKKECGLKFGWISFIPLESIRSISFIGLDLDVAGYWTKSKHRRTASASKWQHKITHLQTVCKPNQSKPATTNTTIGLCHLSESSYDPLFRSGCFEKWEQTSRTIENN